MAKADADQDGLAAARYLTETERQQRVDELGNQRRAWRLDAVRDAMQAVPDELQTEVWIFPPFLHFRFRSFSFQAYRFLSSDIGIIPKVSYPSFTSILLCP